MTTDGSDLTDALHPDVEDACQQIDAVLFSGCPGEHGLDRLDFFVDRWKREIKSHREMNEEMKLKELEKSGW